MRVQPVRSPLIKAEDNLIDIFTSLVSTVPERSVIAVASKVVSTVENRFVPKPASDQQEKFELAKTEAEWYTDPHSSKYGLMLTIKRNWMFMFAGIDESNADNQYILWPADPQQAVNTFWSQLRQQYHLKELGVIMTDSSSIPLNWGVTGQAIAHCGFYPLRSYIDKPDLFGRPMRMEQLNIMQCLASAAVLEMGEGAESQPFAVITELPTNLEFHDHVPNQAELTALRIEKEDDAFAPLLTAVQWKKGKGGK